MRSPFALLLFVCMGTAWSQAAPKVWPYHIPAPPPLEGPPVLNAPYSGDRAVDESLSHHDNVPKREYRDSAGRTRKEEPRRAAGPSPEPLAIVYITDPIAGVQLVLDVENKIAHRQLIPLKTKSPVVPKAPSGSCAGPTPSYQSTDPQSGGPAGMEPFPRDNCPPQPSSKRPPTAQNKKLGKRVIDGIPTEGVRYTSPGHADEIWTSPELHIVILSTKHQQMMSTVAQLMNISRAEPDPALFQVPPGYRIIDEAGAFTIPISLR